MVISTMLGTCEVVPVMVKSLLEEVELRVSEKNVVEEASGLAFTSIVTPAAGIPEVIEICKGKSGPGAGTSVELMAGVVVTCRAVSVQGPDDFFEQNGIIPNNITEAR
jgi:hypothetical protein